MKSIVYARILLVLIPTAVMLPVMSGARVIHVPVEVATIKAGILAAEDGDTIMVAAGVYTGTGFRDLDFGGKAIVVRSQKGSEATVLDCNGTRLEPHRAFWVHQGEDTTTMIEGFTIRDGFGLNDGPSGHSVGGGIFCVNGSSPRIRDCVFYNNQAAHAGGGLCCAGGASPVVDSCIFMNNRVLRTGITGYGGAAQCDGSSPAFRDCFFSSNQANLGGAVSCTGSGASFDGCEFSDNTAETFVPSQPLSPGVGGAMHIISSSPAVTRCLFNRNRALGGPNSAMQGARGGGLACYASLPVLTNCTFFGNIAEPCDDTILGLGAAIFVQASPAQIINSIITFNSQAEAVYCEDTRDDPAAAVPAFSCCDIYGNELGDWIDGFADQLDQSGNISLDPLFCDTVAGNFHIRRESPCGPDNGICLTVIGAFGVGCEMAADDADIRPPSTLVLAQNHPNPFNQSTTISYTLSSSSHVRLVIYNVLGQPIRRLVDRIETAGSHVARWDGKDRFGRDVASGIYVYSIFADTERDTKKMILTR